MHDAPVVPAICTYLLLFFVFEIPWFFFVLLLAFEKYLGGVFELLMQRNGQKTR
jgi:hypothetical protein